MIKTFVLLAFLLVFTQSSLQPQTFTIQVRYGSDQETNQNWQNVGSLRIHKSQYDDPTVDLKTDRLIDPRNEIFKIKTGFASIKLTDNTNEQNSWITYVDGQQLQKFNYPTNEVLKLIVSSSSSLISFDYSLQKKSKKQPDSKTIVKFSLYQDAPKFEPEPEVVQTPQEEQQPSGIFGMIFKYKWWIIGFFLVFTLVGNQDPQKLNEQVNQQAGGQQQRRTRAQ